MALANLLSHKALDSDVISKPLGGRAIKRCNKDLGRVLALARLEGESYLDWLVDWKRALATNLPGQTQSLSRSVGSGLRALVASAADFDEAWFTCTIGLLSGANVSKDQLMITAQRTLGDLIEPFENME